MGEDDVGEGGLCMSADSNSEGSVPRALITGIRGFTGRYLVAELKAAGYRVFGTARRPEPGVEDVYTVDLLDRSALKDVVKIVRPDVVAHLAAISFIPHGDPEIIYRTNLIGTRNLLEALACSSALPRAVLLSSSANVYGNSSFEYIDECVEPAPANDYSVSKLAMEYMARLWMDRLPIVVARPFNYTGVGQSVNFLLPKIVDHFRRGEREIELGNLDVVRDFADVRTTASAYRRLIEVAPAGETVNVCSGQAYSFSNVLSMMSDIAGYEIAVKVNPVFIREKEVMRLVGSNAKLQRLVGNVSPIPLSETLRWMYSETVA